MGFVKFFVVRCKHLGHGALVKEIFVRGKFVISRQFKDAQRTPSNLRFFEYVCVWVCGCVSE